MTPELAVEHVQQALWIAALVSAPVLVVALVVGVGASVIQAATQIHEPALAFLPKAVAVGAAILFAGTWMLGLASGYLADTLRGLSGAAP